MCGRYYIEPDASSLRGIVGAADPSGAIRPGDGAPVMVAGSVLQNLQWGFPGFSGSRLLINARAESLFEKPSFEKAFTETRCVIPATGFYEWQRVRGGRVKKFFTRPGGLIYMAGAYKRGAACFVIATTEARGAVASIHSRMPVLLKEEEIEGYLRDLSLARELLLRPGLEATMTPCPGEAEQLSFL